jgi:nucleotide-binding universal stress UspA family protein
MAGPLIAPIANVWTETIERSRKDLQAQVQPLLDRGVPLTTQLLGGPPHEALEMLSDDAALVVVGSSGRGSIGRKVLGSVSCHVVQHARCPVVVIPPAVSKQWESPPQP